MAAQDKGDSDSNTQIQDPTTLLQKRLFNMSMRNGADKRWQSTRHQCLIDQFAQATKRKKNLEQTYISYSSIYVQDQPKAPALVPANQVDTRFFPVGLDFLRFLSSRATFKPVQNDK